jgi:hypothetical protein
MGMWLLIVAASTLIECLAALLINRDLKSQGIVIPVLGMGSIGFFRESYKEHKRIFPRSKLRAVFFVSLCIFVLNFFYAAIFWSR